MQDREAGRFLGLAIYYVKLNESRRKDGLKDYIIEVLGVSPYLRGRTRSRKEVEAKNGDVIVIISHLARMAVWNADGATSDMAKSHSFRGLRPLSSADKAVKIPFRRH